MHTLEIERHFQDKQQSVHVHVSGNFFLGNTLVPNDQQAQNFTIVLAHDEFKLTEIV